MFLTDDEVIQFEAMYLQEFGKDISKEDVLVRGIKLSRLFEIVYKSMKNYELKDKKI